MLILDFVDFNIPFASLYMAKMLVMTIVQAMRTLDSFWR